MAASSIDPQRCFRSIVRLGALSYVYSAPVRMFNHTELWPGHSLSKRLVGTVLFSGIFFPPVLGLFKAVGMPISYPRAVRNVWGDCDIGGGLKRKLEQFKAKASEVAGKLLPTPAPGLVPIAASYVALDLAMELGSRTAIVSADLMTTGGNGMVDKVFKGVVVGGVLVYGGIALAPVLTAAVPSGAPILAGAATL